MTLRLRANPNWDYRQQRGTAQCHFEPIVICGVVFNILADISLLGWVLPKICKFKLQIAQRQKIPLLLILGLSILVIIAGSVRCVRVSYEIESTVDIPYVSNDLTIWTSVEMNTGIFYASAPSFKPLLRKIAPGLLSSAYRSKNTSNFGNYASGTRTGKRTVTKEAFKLSSQTNLGTTGAEDRAEDIWTGGRKHGNTSSISDIGSEQDDILIGIGGVPRGG
ncbi:uncharacterized protein LY89DRAFT_744549 [Mollisia scopiformis]|uniref:Rhodopsin domain-containing protein n=1 Tax=Mollisia scopiformis TaxID=149040 RepID=A0A194XW68_MOLSC|nr:uncharacterized protein LY89DRAFT_744549 [Mollisia scopiformis]KUJ23967.1 hypothetical protein LY89DRAFT_744549 [Mollisia scopiformis]